MLSRHSAGTHQGNELTRNTSGNPRSQYKILVCEGREKKSPPTCAFEGRWIKVVRIADLGRNII